MPAQNFVVGHRLQLLDVRLNVYMLEGIDPHSRKFPSKQKMQLLDKVPLAIGADGVRASPTFMPDPLSNFSWI